MTANTILVIVGPTASGKTELSLRLAEAFNGEIVSADSVQVYRGLDIGSAKADAAERARVAHHMIDVVEPDERGFSVAAFRELAGECVRGILSRRRLPIVVGGSGLYVDSLTRPLNFADTASDAAVRRQLEAEYDDDRSALYSELTRIDPTAASKIHINNKKRVVRALEIYRVSGQTMTERGGDFRNPSAGDAEFAPVMLGLRVEREALYRRIDRRVDAMMENGLLDEARALYDRRLDRALPAMQALGYKQLFEYFDGNLSLDEAVDAIKRETRRFSKRQMTWFARDDRIIWMDAADGVPPTEMLQSALELVLPKLNGGVE